MADVENQISVSLPDDVRRRFSELEQRLWKVETTVAVCLALSGLGFSYLLLFLSDRIWDTAIASRIAVSLIGLGIALAGIARWSLRWVFKRRDLKALSILVQQKYRRLGDRLLGIVELADEKERPPHFSPALYRAAIQQVAEDARKFDFQEAVSLRPAKVQAATALGLFVLALLPAAAVPRASWNAFQRWATPWAAIERYTLVNIAGLPAKQIVPHGEPFEVVSAVEYRSFWHPARAQGQYERQPAIKTLVQDERVQLKIPGQVQPGRLSVRVGDARREVPVEPTHRPSLKDLIARIDLPAYLKYPALTENIRSGSLTVLEGSQVSFQGKITRGLQSAELAVESSDPQRLAVQGDAFASQPVNLDGAFHCSFTWQDELGLETAAPWRLSVQSQKDLPPLPELPEMNREVAVLETEVVPLKAVAQDDYGVRELGLTWNLISDWQPTNSPSATPFKYVAASAQEKKLERAFKFNPALLKIPAGSLVELRAYAKDFFPDREPTESPVYRIYVVGNEQHAEMVRQKFESLLGRLEEVTRLEEKIVDETRELKDLPKDKLAEDKASDQIADTLEDQAQNKANLEQLSREGTQMLQEAFRNPLLPEQTLREWADTVQQMQGLTQDKMPQAAESMKAAQQNPKSREENLAKALEKEEEILEALQKMQQMVNKKLDDLQAMTLAQRLRKLGTEQKEIESRLHKNLTVTIGLLPKDLPAPYQRANTNLATFQSRAEEETKTLQGEISRFFERTREPNYGQVSKEMTEAKTTDELDKVRGLIAENISMEAIQQLGRWSSQFNAWAELLEPKSSSAGGAGGGGGGQANDLANFLIQQLLSLLRMRESEINLRERTELLETRKEDTAVYQDGAQALYAGQRQLLKKLTQMQLENPFPPLEEPLSEIFDAMQGAEALLGVPQTDALTVQSETKTVETLSDVINLINEQIQRGGSSQSNASEEMAFLLQMMSPESRQTTGMSMSRNPGRSTMGGNTQQPAGPLQGDAQGKSPDARGVNKTSSLMENLPTEFREALENYFNALEKEAN
ncbi:MAG: hypothetical protein FJ398_10215 [Verrucomicrobia bacterium]|nr:hypothetical protein [Verrucomicrobiota bacterium]